MMFPLPCIQISVRGNILVSQKTQNTPLYITYLCICKNWNTSSQQNICIIENAGFRVAEFIYACVVEQEHIDVQIKEVQ